MGPEEVHNSFLKKTLSWGSNEEACIWVAEDELFDLPVEEEGEPLELQNDEYIYSSELSADYSPKKEGISRSSSASLSKDDLEIFRLGGESVIVKESDQNWHWGGGTRHPHPSTSFSSQTSIRKSGNIGGLGGGWCVTQHLFQF